MKRPSDILRVVCWLNPLYKYETGMYMSLSYNQDNEKTKMERTDDGTSTTHETSQPQRH